MLKIKDSGDIELTRGDSAALSVVPVQSDTEEIYRLKDGDSVKFTVYSMTGGEPIIEKVSETQSDEGEITFDFLPEETEIERGEYVYDVKLVSAGGVETFIGGEPYPRTILLV